MSGVSRKTGVEKAVKAIQGALPQAQPKPISTPPLGAVAAADGFTGTLRGTDIPFPGVQVKQIEYTKRRKEERDNLRAEFEKKGGPRENFIKSIASDSGKIELLNEAGLRSGQIIRMKENGEVPRGWQVHHKLPLDGGGTNEFDNLVLVKNSAYYQALTKQQNEQTCDIKEGETKQVSLPIPDAFVYPARKF